MIRWIDHAIILELKKHGDHGAVITCFTKDHGLYKAYLRYAFSKNKQAIYQTGNVVLMTWEARTEEQLGNITAELVEPYCALVLYDRIRLLALQSFLHTVSQFFAEREAHSKFFSTLLQFLESLKHNHLWQQYYVLGELALLTELGYGLDLSTCAASGTSENLCYVSPKSGRAVSASEGEPYHDKLFHLPDFLQKNDTISPENPLETLKGLALCGYFLDKYLCKPYNKQLPLMRNELTTLLTK